MPTITLSKKELLRALGKKLSDKELADRIAMLGTDLEGIEGDEIAVEVFPNRPDLLSQQGFARALASFLDLPGKTGLREWKMKDSGVTVTIDKSAANCRPYTACAVIRNLKLDEEKIREIIMVQEKLHITYGRNRKKIAIGIYPMEHIKPPIFLRGLKPKDIEFQPLEWRAPMTAKEILEEHPKGKEYAHLVDGLTHYGCFLDSKGNYLSFTPIINSHLTGKVSEKTKDVFVECSGFDFRVVSLALNMIVTALGDMGGSVETCKLKYEHGKLGTVTTPYLNTRRKKIDLAYINKWLGLELTEKELQHYLERMGFGYDKNKHEVLIPAYRTDILHQVDFAEDIAIAYGYENFTPTIPTTSTVGEESWQSKVDRKLREHLAGHGLLEVINYHLVNGDTQAIVYPDAKDAVPLKNSVSREYDTMRRTPVVSLLLTLARNKHHEYPQRIFEIGSGFTTDGKRVNERKYLTAIVAADEADYTIARQLLDSIALAMGTKFDYAEAKAQWLMSGRTAKISCGKKSVGALGEVNPAVLEEFGIEMPCAAFVLDLEAFK